MFFFSVIKRNNIFGIKILNNPQHCLLISQAHNPRGTSSKIHKNRAYLQFHQCKIAAMHFGIRFF
jgi:hypothetical protein